MQSVVIYSSHISSVNLAAEVAAELSRKRDAEQEAESSSDQLSDNDLQVNGEHVVY